MYLHIVFIQVITFYNVKDVVTSGCAVTLTLVGVICVLIDGSKPEPWITHLIAGLIGK